MTLEDKFAEPTDRFMRELICQIFENIVSEATLAGNKKRARAERKRLNEIISFANNKEDYWWICLDLFCPSIDPNKLSDIIIKRANKTLSNL